VGASVSGAVDPSAGGPKDHIVQFFDDDTELVVASSEFLGVTVEAGGVAVAIASASHLAAIAGQLGERGIDAVGAQESGHLRFHDAHAMMATFSTDGRFDHEAWHCEIGQLLTQWRRAGRPLRIYGELVALLWEAGAALSALEVERVWNDLARSHAFSLYCTYRVSLVSGIEHTHAVDELAHLHSSVLNPATTDHFDGPGCTQNTASREYGAQVAAVGDARHFVAATLRAWECGSECTDDVVLAVNELAANAIVHADSGFTLTLSLSDGVVRVEVRDAGAKRAGPDHSTLTPRPGRGLGLVATLARHWGVTEFDDGRAVWADFEKRGLERRGVIGQEAAPA